MGEEKRCMTFKAVGWPTFSFLNVVILSQRSAWQSQGLPTKDLRTPPTVDRRGVPHLSRPLRKVGASNSTSGVLPTRTLSFRAKKDRPPTDDLTQSRDLVSADA